MKQRFWLLLAIVCVTVTCALAQSVTIDWQRGHDFSQYHTYAWAQPVHPVQNSAQNEQIMGSIDEALQGRGMRKVEPGASPDLVIVYNAGAKDGDSLQGYRVPRFAGSDGMGKALQQDTTLVIDVADTRTRTVIWRAIAPGALSDKQDKKSDRVQRAAVKMIKSFPPK